MSDKNKEDEYLFKSNIPSIPGISGIIEIDNQFLGKTKQCKAGSGQSSQNPTPDMDDKSLISLYMGIEYTDMKVLSPGLPTPSSPKTQNTNANANASVNANTSSNHNQNQITSNQNQVIITYKFINNKSGVNRPQTIPKRKGKPKTPTAMANTQKDTNWVNVLVGNLRTNLHGTFHGIGDKNLQRFLDEYCFKFNRREKPQEIFETLLFDCTKTRNISKKELIL